MKDKRKKYRVVIEFVVDNERDEGADECLARAYYGEPGDQYVHLNIKVPSSLSKEQKEILNKFKEASKPNDSWFTKFKKAFKK